MKSKCYIEKDMTYWMIADGIHKGKIHRENGPAIEYNSGTKYWVYEGYYHRIDGPAIIEASGNKKWYLNNKRFYTVEEWLAALTPKQKENYIWNINK